MSAVVGVGGGHDRARLGEDLVRLGVREGWILLVQASLRAVAPAGRSPEAVVGALLDVLGPDGTLVVPTYTGMNSTTSRAFRAATSGMSPEEIAVYVDSLPPFDPAATPSLSMGALAECVRTLPTAVRSVHPHTSFAAVGARAAELMKTHDLESHLGERSPLGALHAHEAMVLMLGSKYATSTIFHLAEYAYAPQPLRSYEARVASASEGSQSGPSGWIRFKDIDFDDSDFGLLGLDFEHAGGAVRCGQVGSAQSKLFSARSAVDYAVAWMRANRNQGTGLPVQGD